MLMPSSRHAGNVVVMIVEVVVGVVQCRDCWIGPVVVMIVPMVVVVVVMLIRWWSGGHDSANGCGDGHWSLTFYLCIFLRFCRGRPRPFASHRRWLLFDTLSPLKW